MRKRCRICHVMADLDENGRCSFCNDVYMASQLNMTYGKYMMQKDAVSVTAEESRLKFFREQLTAANKRLDYAVRNRYPETVCADRGDAVSFYNDIIKILEGKSND